MDDKSFGFARKIDGYNELVLGNLLLHDSWRSLPRFGQSFLRNIIGFNIMYFVGSALWSLYTYCLNRQVFSPEVSKTRKKFIVQQIWQSMKAFPVPLMLESLWESMVVKGWTRCYLNIEEVGWLMYVVYLIVHLAMLDCGMYWLHRATHEVKLLYRLCHAEHHVYNSKHKLSPFAGISSSMNNNRERNIASKALQLPPSQSLQIQ